MPPAARSPRMLQGDEADVYRQHHHALMNVLRAKVTAPDTLREDACSYAWLQFLRLQPDRATAFAWLCTVAINQAYDLTAKQRRAQLVESLAEHPDAVAPVDTETAADARQALAALAGLPDRQRRYLTLLIAGHTYADISRRTGATHTNVNKHLVRARRTLRAARQLDN